MGLLGRACWYLRLSGVRSVWGNWVELAETEIVVCVCWAGKKETAGQNKARKLTGVYNLRVISLPWKQVR